MNASLFCHAGLQMPVCVLGGTPHYNVQALLRNLAAIRSAGGTSSGSPQSLAERRASRLCEKLDDAGVQSSSFVETCTCVVTSPGSGDYNYCNFVNFLLFRR
jgi:hypothetical protein